MARYKVQVIDEAGQIIADKTVEAEEYADACEQVARQAREDGSAYDPVLRTSGSPSAGTASTSTGSTLDGSNKMDKDFKLG